MPGLSFLKKKKSLSHINDTTNSLSYWPAAAQSRAVRKEEFSLMRQFSWLSSSLLHEQVLNNPARAHLTPASKGCWCETAPGAKGLELPLYKQSQKPINPLSNALTELHS